MADVRFGEGDADGQDADVCVSNVRRLGADFDHDVSGLVWHNGQIYFSALVDEAVQSIFRASLDGSVERLTPGSWWTDLFSPFAILDREDGSGGFDSMAALVEKLDSVNHCGIPRLYSIDVEGGDVNRPSYYLVGWSTKRYVKIEENDGTYTFTLPAASGSVL